MPCFRSAALRHATVPLYAVVQSIMHETTNEPVTAAEAFENSRMENTIREARRVEVEARTVIDT